MLFKHSIIYMLAKIIPGIMAFAGLSVYTHLLTPDQYGVYTLIFTRTIFIHNGLINWLPAGTLRFWSNTDYSEQSFTSTLAISYIKIAFIFFLIALVGIIFYWGEQQAIWIINVYLLLLAVSLFTITQYLFSARIQPLKYAYITIGYSILAFSFGALLAYLGYGASGVITGITIGTAIPALIVFKRIWLPFNKKAYNKKLFKNMLVYGLPISSAFFLEEITKTADRFMLAGLQDKAQAGLYAVGYDLSGNSIFLLMTAINLAAYPVVIKLLDSEGKQAAMDYFRHYAILLIGVAIPAVVGLNLLGPDLVFLLIDKDYQESVIFLLPWITVALFLMGLQAFYFDLAFQLGHYTMGIVKIGIVIASVNILLNYLLIPPMGIKGAAIATISSFAIGTVLSAIMGRKCFSLPFPIADFGKIIIASTFMGFCLWWLKDMRGWGWLVLQLTLGIISYGTVVYAFNLLDIRDSIKVFFRNKRSQKF
jgi:O-antigen/teichoic acid export membrane protein